MLATGKKIVAVLAVVLCLFGLTQFATFRNANAQIPGIFQPVLAGAVTTSPIATTATATTDTGGSDVNSTTVTFAGLSIGAAFATRTVCAAIAGKTQSTVATTFTSGTIGGISATTIVAPGSRAEQAVIMCAAVPTGTTATVTFVFANNFARGGVQVWSLTNVQSLTPTATITSTASPFSSGALSNSAGGAALVAAQCSDVVTFTPTNYTEDADGTIQAANSYTMGHQDQASSGSPTYTITPSSGCSAGARISSFATLR